MVMRKSTVEWSMAKMARMEEAPVGDLGAFEVLPLELIVSVLATVSSSADKPADLLSAMLTCKKFWKLGKNQEVGKVASVRCVSVRAAKWCRGAYHFLRRCGNAGNADANYLLGMIQFYCLGNREQGWSRMLEAVRSGHAEATFALAIIRLNGSDGIVVDDAARRAAVHLCGAAASLGQLGHCLVNGLGVPQDTLRGRCLNARANRRRVPGRARA